LPLWSSDKCTTYTEAQQFCARQYAKRGPKLIAGVSQHLELLAEVKDPVDSLKVLYDLNDLSIDLSCFNPEWNDFSLVVFENVLFPRSKTWMISALKTSYDNTLRRLEHSGTEPGT